jgi:Fe-S cluster assembly iron-binding protein IscA
MNLTTKAAERIRDLIIEENEPSLKGLRVAVRGGGCEVKGKTKGKMV